MTKKRKLSGSSPIKVEVKEENIMGNDYLMAKGRLKGVLRQLTENTDSDSEYSDDNRGYRSRKYVNFVFVLFLIRITVYSCHFVFWLQFSVILHLQFPVISCLQFPAISCLQFPVISCLQFSVMRYLHFFLNCFFCTVFYSRDFYCFYRGESPRNANTEIYV